MKTIRMYVYQMEDGRLMVIKTDAVQSFNCPPFRLFDDEGAVLMNFLGSVESDTLTGGYAAWIEKHPGDTPPAPEPPAPPRNVLLIGGYIVLAGIMVAVAAVLAAGIFLAFR